MRVALITRTLEPDGGVAVHVRRSGEALAAAGHEVVVYASAGTSPGSFALRRFPGLEDGAPDSAARASLTQDVSALRPDVVHLHHVEDLRLLESLRSATPVVTSAHGYPGCAPNTRYFHDGHECWRPHGPGCVFHMLVTNCKHQLDPRPVPRMYREARDRLGVLRSSDAVVSYSHAVDRHLAINELEHRWLVPLFEPPAEQRPYRPDGPIVFSGRVVGAKGLDVLIRAAPMIDREVVVTGDGWALPEARRLATELGVAERVRFTGWTGGPGLATAYRDASVVVVPSRWPEPFGLVGLEAMAHGRPVVASAIGGIPDWLDDGRTGTLVPVGDSDALAAAVNALLRDPAEAAAMGTRGRARLIEHFSAEAHVRALEAVYASAAARA